MKTKTHRKSAATHSRASSTARPRSSAKAGATHVNRDPITTEKGAHPVGVGIGAGASGAAVGAATGAVIGTIAGPLGTAVGGAIGATVGAIAGAYGGRGAAEKLNPTTKKAPKKLPAHKAKTHSTKTTSKR